LVGAGSFTARGNIHILVQVLVLFTERISNGIKVREDYICICSMNTYRGGQISSPQPEVAYVLGNPRPLRVYLHKSALA